MLLITLAALFMIIWAIAVALSITFGGLIHLLLLVVFILIMMRLLDGKKSIPGAS